MSDAPLSIVHVVESLERGGLERVVVDLVLAQRDSGHSVGVVCLFQRGSFGDDLAAKDVEVIECGKQPGVDWQAMGLIRQYVRKRAATIVHTHNPVAHYYAVPATLFSGVQRRINTRHGMGARRRYTTRETFYRLTTPFTHAQVAVSAEGQRAFEERNTFARRKSAVVVNGIPVEHIAHVADNARDASRAALGIAEDACLLGHVGRLNWAKDQATLLRAFRQALDALPGLRLLIIGDGDLRPALEAQAAELSLGDNVIFAGERPDVFELLGAMDVFVLSSVTEGYSIALLEASAAGLPIVATDVGGNSEIVQNGATGNLVPAKDAETLSRAMVELASAPARQSDYGAAARQWAQRHASVEAMADAYERLYRGRQP